MAAAPHSHPPSADRRPEGRAGSRRIFPPHFKLQVLEAYRRDAQCRGNQRATARKFGIHRRQIQKWLQAEPALRESLLRRAPQPAPSPPPYAAGSPESARLPSPPPVSLPTPMSAVPLTNAEPIDLSVRRSSPPLPVPVLRSSPAHTPATAPQPHRKPFKLFRPYLLEDEEDRRELSAPQVVTAHVSAFSPVQNISAGCALLACGAPRWSMPMPAFPAPLSTRLVKLHARVNERPAPKRGSGERTGSAGATDTRHATNQTGFALVLQNEIHLVSGDSRVY